MLKKQPLHHEEDYKPQGSIFATQEIESFVANDPYVKAGLVSKWCGLCTGKYKHCCLCSKLYSQGHCCLQDNPEIYGSRRAV